MRVIPNDLIDIRRFVPRDSNYPTPVCALFKNSLVRCCWFPPSWQQADWVNKSPTWIPKWYAYVLEFDALIPGDELLYPAEDFP